MGWAKGLATPPQLIHVHIRKPKGRDGLGKKVGPLTFFGSCEHSTFGRVMAKRTCFVMVKMCMPVRENWAKFAFARVAADKGERHNTSRALKGHHGHPVCGKGVVFSRRALYFIFLSIFEPILHSNPLKNAFFGQNNCFGHPYLHSHSKAPLTAIRKGYTQQMLSRPTQRASTLTRRFHKRLKWIPKAGSMDPK